MQSFCLRISNKSESFYKGDVVMTKEELNEIEELRKAWELADMKRKIAYDKVKEKGSRAAFDEHNRYGLEAAELKDKLINKIHPLLGEIRRLRVALEGIMFMAKEGQEPMKVESIYQMAHDALGINDFLKR